MTLGQAWQRILCVFGWHGRFLVLDRNEGTGNDVADCASCGAQFWIDRR